jgi:hypothetical protein
MKWLLAFALAITLFTAPAMALAEDKTVGELCRSVPGPSWTEVFYPGLCQ